jgi:hypothetical protein
MPIWPTQGSNHPFTAFSEHHRGEGFVQEDLLELVNVLFRFDPRCAPTGNYAA